MGERRKTKNHSKERKNGEALSVEKQTKSLFSNTSKILHVYLLSTLALSYIPDEPSKETEETDEELKPQHFSTLLSKAPCLLIISLFPPTNLGRTCQTGKKGTTVIKLKKYF